jgi:hypothetical protein
MESFYSYLAWAGVVVFGLLTLHALFKTFQSFGANRLNSALTSVGGGSFTESIMAKVRWLLWLCMIFIYGTLTSTSLVYTDPDHKKKSSASKSTSNEVGIKTPENAAKDIPATDLNSTKSPSEAGNSATQYDGDDPVIRARLGLPPKQ